MGAVYAGVDLTSGTRVAVKLMLSPDLTFSRSQLVRFEREARAASSVETSHIVKVLDFGTDAELGAPFMVLEYLTGSDVDRAVKTHGPLPIQSALRIVAQAAVGIARAHDRGIIHRDIKSANLYLHEPRAGALEVKVLDFGIAKVLLDDVEGQGPEVLTRTGAILGSPLYMSPEQAQGLKGVDHRTDIWSLGIVLYEALSARTPFSGSESMAQLMLKIISCRPEPVNAICPWVPDEVNRIVGRCLRHDPEERYPSARALAAAVGEFLGKNDFSLKAEDVRSLDDTERLPVAPAPVENTLSLLPAPLQSPPTERATAPATNTIPAAGTLPVGATADGVAATSAVQKPARRAWIWAAVAVAGVVIAGGVFAAGPPSSAKSEGSAAPPLESPHERSFRLAVGPPGVTVELDGHPLPVVDGAVIIVGHPGNTLRVHLRLGERETVRDVALTDQGPLPASIVAEGSPAIAVTPVVAPSAPAAAPGRPSSRPRAAASAAPSAGVPPEAPRPKSAADKLQQVFE